MHRSLLVIVVVCSSLFACNSGVPQGNRVRLQAPLWGDAFFVSQQQAEHYVEADEPAYIIGVIAAHEELANTLTREKVSGGPWWNSSFQVPWVTAEFSESPVSIYSSWGFADFAQPNSSESDSEHSAEVKWEVIPNPASAKPAVQTFKEAGPEGLKVGLNKADFLQTIPQLRPGHAKRIALRFQKYLDMHGRGKVMAAITEKMPGTTASDIAELFAAVQSRGGINPPRGRISKNTPNPFNPATTLTYSVLGTSSSSVRLYIYNMLGQTVRSLVNTTVDPGAYTVRWDGRDESGREVTSGIYLARLEVGNSEPSHWKLQLLK